MKARFAAALILAAALSACKGQSRAEDPVVRGQRYFSGLGCAKCHMIGDVGNDWGPNLTLIGFRKSPEWLDLWLKNPHAWNPKSVMPSFHLSDGVRSDLVAYLSAQKGQAWSTYPWRTADAAALPKLERGRLIFNKAGCVACHGQNGGGGYPNNNVAGGLIPSLTNVVDGYSFKEAHERIRGGSTPLPDDPSKPKPMIRMPVWGEQLKPDEIDAVVTYIFSLKPKTAAGKDEF